MDDDVKGIKPVLNDLLSKGWTLAAIADALGVSRRAVDRWGNGTRKPTNPRLVLAALCDLNRRKRIPKRHRAKSTAYAGETDPGTQEMEESRVVNVTPDVTSYRCELCGYRWDLPKELPAPVACPNCKSRVESFILIVRRPLDTAGRAVLALLYEAERLVS